MINNISSQSIGYNYKILEVLSSLLPLAIIMSIFYFLMIRPQQKKAEDHKTMVKKIKIGDTIITSGGIIAKVITTNGTSDILTAEISPGTHVKIKKYTIMNNIVTCPNIQK